MSEIIKNLFLGEISYTVHQEFLKNNKITHILTINIKPIEHKFKELNIKTKWIYAIDIESCDLLSHFQDCIDFIDLAISNNTGILVHCQFGVSRSATIVIAYIMQKRSLEYLKAKTFVHEKRRIYPNDGFEKQLKLFEIMNYKIDNNHSEYKKFKLSVLTEERKMNKSNLDNLKCDPVNVIDIDNNSNSIYSCGKCRHKLFTQNSIIMHENKETNMNCLQSIFIEPVKWMENLILEDEGKIYCPKCSAKIGRYSWSGMPCICKQWITPSFHIRNDMIQKPPNVTLLK